MKAARLLAVGEMLVEDVPKPEPGYGAACLAGIRRLTVGPPEWGPGWNGCSPALASPAIPISPAAIVRPVGWDGSISATI